MTDASPPIPPADKRYLAATAYLEPQVPARYEEARFSGRLGRYRHRREQQGVGEMIAMLPGDLRVLDCPCGTGRWWQLLATRASEIQAVDLSPAMLDAARARSHPSGVQVSVGQNDAEALTFPDQAFDLVFSHALTKHLPIPVQAQVLSEFARVSRRWVICSVSLFHRTTLEVWRRRNFVDSYPLLPEQLTDLATAAGLKEVAKRRCTTPIGVEHSVLFEKVY